MPNPPITTTTTTTTTIRWAHGLLRIVAAYLFLLHGASKLLHVPHIPALDGLPMLSLMGAAGVLELFGGILLLAGLFSRPVAFVLAGEMAVAYFLAHASASTVLLPLLNGGEAAILFCFVFLFIAAAGPGACSLDSLWRRSRLQAAGAVATRET